MKLHLLFLSFLSLFLFCCQQHSKNITVDNKQCSINIDNTLRDTLSSNIQFVSDRRSSHFKTPIEAKFYSNGVVVDSIIQDDFSMSSWYSSVHKDTVDLVAHMGELETVALLVRFIKGKPSAFFYRAPHSQQKYFRLNKTDLFASQIEVPPVRCKLELSQVPDSANKPIVFGSIDMESSDYYDRRDNLQRPEKAQMKFYFRSQFREFKY